MAAGSLWLCRECWQNRCAFHQTLVPVPDEGLGLVRVWLSSECGTASGWPYKTNGGHLSNNKFTSESMFDNEENRTDNSKVTAHADQGSSARACTLLIIDKLDRVASPVSPSHRVSQPGHDAGGTLLASSRKTPLFPLRLR